MIMDYHIHTKASSDATGSMKDYIEEARKRGIDEIGFSDHILFHYEGPQNNRPPDFMENYVVRFLEIKETSRIPIRLGAEIDFFPDKVSEIREFIRRYPFDYVIGAVHYIGNWLIDSRSQMHEYLKRDITQVYEEYFRIVRELCKSKLFDILAHADLIKIFGVKPSYDLSGLFNETAEAISDSNICVEVNTRGLMRPCAEIYPSKQFLKVLNNHRAPITLGSDAHNPQDVGRSFDRALRLVRKVGYTHACTFSSRTKRMKRIGYSRRLSDG